MLPDPARQRLRDHLTALTPIDVTWTPPGGSQRTQTVDPTIVWAFDADLDVPDDYPVVALDFQTTAIERRRQQPLDEIIARVASNDSTVAHVEKRGARLYDELAVYVEVAQDLGDIPQRVVAQQLAAWVWYEYRFNADYLNSQGGDYEWPVLVRPLDAASGPTRTTPVTEDASDATVGTIETFEATFQVRYTATVAIDREAVDQIAWTLTIEAPDGTELGTTSGTTDV